MNNNVDSSDLYNLAYNYAVHFKNEHFKNESAIDIIDRVLYFYERERYHIYVRAIPNITYQTDEFENLLEICMSVRQKLIEENSELDVPIHRFRLETEVVCYPDWGWPDEMENQRWEHFDVSDFMIKYNRSKSLDILIP